MRSLIIKTYRYGDLKSDPRFSLEIAFRRLNGVLETVRKTLPEEEILIVVPAEELTEATHSVKIGRNQRLTTLEALENEREWFNSTRQMLVFDEQGFYVSPQLIRKVISMPRSPSRSFADPEKLAWSFNYHDSLRFFVAPADAVFKHVGMAESGGFPAFQEASLGSNWARYDLKAEDLPPIYARAIKFNPYPYHYYIEPTSRCNSKCVMCPFHSEDQDIAKGKVYLGDGGDNMPLELFKSVVDQIASIGWNYLPHYRTPMVTAQLQGEPTMAPDCKEMFKYVKEKGFKLSFSTNGSLLHKNNLAEFLVDIGADEVIISADSANSDEYHKMRPQLDYDRMVENIKLLREVRDKRGASFPVIYTKRVHLRGGDDEADRRYIEKFTQYADWAGMGYENYVDEKTGVKAYSNYYMDVSTEKRLPCFLLQDVGIVKANGLVDLCFMGWGHYIGDVNKEPLLAMLRNNPVRKMAIENQIAGEFSIPDFCSPCSSWKANYSTSYEEGDYLVQKNSILVYYKRKDIAAQNSRLPMIKRFMSTIAKLGRK